MFKVLFSNGDVLELMGQTAEEAIIGAGRSMKEVVEFQRMTTKATPESSSLVSQEELSMFLETQYQLARINTVILDSMAHHQLNEVQGVINALREIRG